MDIYQILITHNKMWSWREIVCFSILVLIVLCFMIRSVRERKITILQASAGMVLLFFLGIVFASTVFTRSVGIRQYELVPFWSWWEVIVHHDMSLFQEIILNCILLFPMGLLLPVIRNKKVGAGYAFLAGFGVSCCIELCQLIFLRGLFEWDDMIHNAFGCMMGCIVTNTFISGYQFLRRKRKC